MGCRIGLSLNIRPSGLPRFCFITKHDSYFLPQRLYKYSFYESCFYKCVRHSYQNKRIILIHTLNMSENRRSPSILTSHKHTANNAHTATITPVPTLTSLGGISPMMWRIFSLLNSIFSLSSIVVSIINSHILQYSYHA